MTPTEMHIDALMEKIGKLEAVNADLKLKIELSQPLYSRRKLEAENARYREALEFYADRSVWGYGCAAIDPCDTYADELNVLRGGRRAREALKGE